MIRTIAHKELLEIIRDGRIKWAALIVFALLLSALAVGVTYYREVSTQHETAQRAVREHWVNQTPKNPHSGAHYGIYAFKPKTLLSSIDPGVDPYVGVFVWLEAHNQNQFEYRPAQDATAVQRFGQLTITMVLQLLVPLLIILVTFSVFVGEREQGTFRQLASLGVRPSHLAAGKALGVAGGLGLLLVPAAAIGGVTLVLLTGPAEAVVDSGRMVLMGTFYLIYFTVFVGIALAVSAKANSSRVALVGLLGFWIFNGLIAPRVTTDIVRHLYPSLSAFEFSSGTQRGLAFGLDGNSPYAQRVQNLKKEVLETYGVEKIEDLPINFAGLELETSEEWAAEVFDKYYGLLDDAFRKQNHARQILAVFSPLVAIRSLSMGLAGTDYFQHQDFSQVAEDYRRNMVYLMNRDLTIHGVEYSSENFDYVNYTVGREVWETLPDFEYHVPPVSWALYNHRWSVIVLLFWLAATIVLTFRTTQKISV